jgi:multidrug resistance efflux pump
MTALKWGVFAAVISTTALASGCRGERDLTDLAPPLYQVAPPRTPAPLPGVETRETVPARNEEPIPGLLVVDHKADIGSQLTGEVTAVLAREGDTVRVNQPLIRLDDRALRLEVTAAAAALEAARRRMASGATGTHVTANEVDQVITGAQGDLNVALARRDAARAGLQNTVEANAAETDAARAQKEAADARLARLRSGPRPQEVAAARARMQADEAQLARAVDEARRVQQLVRQGAVAEQSLITTESEQRRLEAELASSQENLALLQEGSRREEIREAEAQQRVAEAALRVAESGRRQVEQQRAELAAAQAQVVHLEAALRVVRDSRVRVDRSRQDADSLAGDVRLSAANLALSRERLRQAVLRSPIAGQITRRQVQPGDSVTADQRILLEIVDPSTLHVEFSVTEMEIPGLRVGMPVWIVLPSLATPRLAGRIESLGAAPRANAPGYVGRVRLPRLPRSARAGMLANVYLKPR